MKIFVAVKRVLDPSVRVRLKGDATGIDLHGVKMTMNPFDEIALEQAIRFKDSGNASEVVAISIGADQCRETLRVAIAMGATGAIHVPSETDVEPLAVAKILAALARRHAPSLIFLGKQAIDDDANQTGQMLAALLDWPQATFASQITLSGSNAQVTREVDGGLQTVSIALPAVVTADLRLNQPRYPTLANVMRARKTAIDSLSAAELGVDIAPRLQVVEIRAPKARKPGAVLASVTELVSKLRQEVDAI